jgi:hypothetical protein
MDSTAIIVVLIALALGGGGGSKKKQPPNPPPKGQCDEGNPIIYDGEPVFGDIRPVQDKDLTHNERIALSDVLTTIESDEGYPQPGPNLCTFELLSKQLGVKTWDGVLTMLTLWRAVPAIKGRSYAQLNEAQRARYGFLFAAVQRHHSKAPADTSLEPVPEEDEALDVDPSEVSADAVYLVENLPAWGSDLPQPKWKDAVKPAPYEHIGQSNENQTWESWLTNLLYWRHFPHLPTKVAGPNTPGAAEWKQLNDIIVPLVAEYYG